MTTAAAAPNQVRWAQPGDRLSLACPLAAAGGSLQFGRGGDGMDPSNCPHCRLEVAADGRHASLVIERVGVRHAGRWQCWRLGETASELAAADIVELRVAEGVPEAPVLVGPDGVELPSNWSVRENELMALGCLVRGAQLDQIDWLMDSTQNVTHLAKLSHHQDDELVDAVGPTRAGGSTRSSLKLNATKQMNGKTVSCVASHRLWLTPMTASLQLNVLYEPSFTISREPGFGVDLIEGMEVTLSCQIDSNPSSPASWVRDSGGGGQANVVAAAARHQQHHPLDDGVMQHDGVLEFKPVRKRDEGWYRCKMENKAGNFSSFGYLMRVQQAAETTTAAKQAAARHHHHQQRPMQPPNQPAAVSITTPAPPPPSPSPESAYYRDCPSRRGAPEIEQPTRRSVQVQLGQRLSLQVRFCCQPQPERLFWIHRHLAMAPGRMLGPYTARDLYASQNSLYCYESTFELEAVRAEDIGTIYMFVANERGQAGAQIQLKLHQQAAPTTSSGGSSSSRDSAFTMTTLASSSAANHRHHHRQRPMMSFMHCALLLTQAISLAALRWAPHPSNWAE